MSDATHLPPIEREALERLYRFGGGKLVRAMVAMFLRLTPERIAEMRSCVQSRDSERLSQVAHSLRSSAAQIGARGIVPLCEELETTAGTADAEQLVAAIDAVAHQFHRACPVLTREERLEL